MVIWLIGISGAGKSTIASELKRHFDAADKKSYVLDGDDVRDFFDNDLGYTREAREMNIKRIMLAAHVLDQNDVTAIVANIAPFEHLRALARSRIKGYIEVFLRKDLQLAAKNDVKAMYAKNASQEQIVGVNIGFDEPLHCDLILDVDKLSVQETTHKVLAYVERV